MSDLYLLHVASSNDCIIGVGKPTLKETVAAFLEVLEDCYSERFIIAKITPKTLSLTPGTISSATFVLRRPTGQSMATYAINFWLAPLKIEGREFLRAKKLESYLTSKHPGIRNLAKDYLNA